MRIRFRTNSASPRGTFSAGQVADVPNKFGKELIDAGYAELVAAARPEPEKAEAENATIEPDENATNPPRGQGR